MLDDEQRDDLEDDDFDKAELEAAVEEAMRAGGAIVIPNPLPRHPPLGAAAVVRPGRVREAR